MITMQKKPATQPIHFTRHILRTMWSPLLILLAGYFLALYLSGNQNENNNLQIKRNLAEHLAQISAGVKDNVTLYQYGLRGLRGSMMSVSPEQFDYKAMQTYTGSRDYLTEFPGARGFGVIRYLEPSMVPSFVAAINAERPDSNIAIRQLTPHQDSLFVIFYIAPELQNKAAIGLDIGSEHDRRQAAISAAYENEVRLTAPLTLVQADNKIQQGFLMLLPVYTISEPGISAEQRMQHLYGWTYAPLLIDEVLATVSGLNQEVALTIADSSHQEHLTFFSRGPTEDLLTHYQQQQTLNLFGRQWLLTLDATPAFVASLNLPSTHQIFLQVIAGALFLGLLVFSIRLILVRRALFVDHQLELAQIAENTLTTANIKLEALVATRTAELSQMNAIQRSILKSASYAIIATDLQGMITIFNPAAEKLLGYQAKEILHQRTPEIFHLPDEVAQYAATLSTELGVQIAPGFSALVTKAKIGEIDIHRWTYVAKNGQTIPVRLSMTNLTNEDGVLVGFLLIAFNLTEQLNRENELAIAKEQADASSRAKSDFLANMSHEIRTPMNAILGLLQLMGNTTLDKRQHDYLEKTHTAARSLLALLNDTLDFSKVEAGKIELERHEFDLSVLLRDLSVLLSSNAYGKPVEVLYRIAPDVPRLIVGDSLRLKQVLLNLAGNAIKFTEQGEVVIAVALEQNQQQQQLQQQPQLRLAFSVQDSGIGMSPEQQKSIFSGFQQAESSISRKYGGTGLGLAISKRLVELMDGSLSVNSKLDVGSTFSFSINVECAAPSSVFDVSSIDIALRILLVEDNPTAQLIVQEMMQRFGWQVDTAADAAQATAFIEEAEQQHTGYDLLFVDWRLPDIDGLSLVKQIRATPLEHSAPMIIMATAYGTNLLAEYSEQVYQLIDAMMIKPFTPDLLFSTVSDLLQGGTAQLPQTPPAVKAIPLKGIHILLVEDNMTNQLVATELLALEGASVTCATSGQEALILLDHLKVNVILMDIQMPDMDGYQTTRLIRQLPQCQTTPILAMTANALPSDKTACLSAGMNDHIAKPFNLDELVAKVLHYTVAKPNRQPKVAANLVLPAPLQSFAALHQLALIEALTRLNSMSLFGRVVQQFNLDFSKALIQLQKGKLSTDTANLMFHSLKSGAASCGCLELAALLAELDSQSRNMATDDFTIAPAQLVALQQFGNVLQALSALVATETAGPSASSRLSQTSITAVTAITGEPATTTVLEDTLPACLGALEQLQSLLIAADMAALSLFEAHQPQLQLIDTALTAQLAAELQALSFAAANETVGTFIHLLTEARVV